MHFNNIIIHKLLVRHCHKIYCFKSVMIQLRDNLWLFKEVLIRSFVCFFGFLFPIMTLYGPVWSWLPIFYSNDYLDSWQAIYPPLPNWALEYRHLTLLPYRSSLCQKDPKMDNWIERLFVNWSTFLNFWSSIILHRMMSHPYQNSLPPSPD